MHSCFQIRVNLFSINVDYGARIRHSEREKLLGLGHIELRGQQREIDWVEVRVLFMSERKTEKIFQVWLVKGGLRWSSDLWPDVGRTSVTWRQHQPALTAMRKNVKLSKGYSKLSEKRLKVVNRVQKKCRAGYIYKGCVSGHVTTETLHHQRFLCTAPKLYSWCRCSDQLKCQWLCF